MSVPPPAFCGHPLDRADQLRSDPARLAEALAVCAVLVVDFGVAVARDED